MILDHLSHAELYRPLGPLFREALDYLAKFDPKTPDGRHDLRGDDLFVLVQTLTTEPAEKRVFESHQRYADIQFVVSGREAIYYSPLAALRPKGDYDPKIDARLYDGANEVPLHLEAGWFTILWPQDGHKPGCVWQKPGEVRKVVAKIRLGELKVYS
jgi:biofilm protein TabA